MACDQQNHVNNVLSLPILYNLSSEGPWASPSPTHDQKHNKVSKCPGLWCLTAIKKNLIMKAIKSLEYM